MDGVMLASDWDGIDCIGFWMSEKFDGIRVTLTNKGLFTRSGRQIAIPSWFPKIDGFSLDGELWAGYGQFCKTVGLSSRSRCRPHDWTDITFQVFDLLGPGPFEERLLHAAQVVIHEGNNWLKETTPKVSGMPTSCPMRLVWHEQCRGRDHLKKFHDTIIAKGGEGVMLRRSMSKHAIGRGTDLMKVKLFKEEEAEVLGYTKSDKVNREFRSLHCRLLSDLSIEFDVGSGLTQYDLKNPPKVGSIITFKYQQNLELGRLRHPVFVRHFYNV